jgi:hypothetical protein
MNESLKTKNIRAAYRRIVKMGEGFQAMYGTNLEFEWDLYSGPDDEYMIDFTIIRKMEDGTLKNFFSVLIESWEEGDMETTPAQCKNQVRDAAMRFLLELE